MTCGDAFVNRLTGQLITYPLDVVRRRMQVASVKGQLDGQLIKSHPAKAMRYFFTTTMHAWRWPPVTLMVCV